LKNAHSDRNLSINRAYYIEMLRRLCEAVHTKRPAHRSINWILHHDKEHLLCSLWPTNRLLKRNHHPVPLIWLRMTCGRF